MTTRKPVARNGSTSKSGSDLALDADEESDAKRLYRDLAKRFHPDLARSEDERSERSGRCSG